MGAAPSRTVPGCGIIPRSPKVRGAKTGDLRMITATFRRLSAMLALALTALVSFGAAADSSGSVTYPGWKAVSSTNWDVNTPAVKNWRSMLARWADGKACESETCTTNGWAAMVAQVKA